MLFFIISLLLLILLNFHISKKLKNLSIKFNLIDKPDGILKKHLESNYLIGGPLIFINLTIIFVFILFNNELLNFYFGNLYTTNQFIYFYLITFSFFITGLIDDKYKINPNFKFLIFAIFLSILIFFDENILLIEIKIFDYNLKIENIFISSILTIFCFLAFINAFNFFDGINLQAGFYTIFIFSVFIANKFYIFFWITLLISIFYYLYLNFKNITFLGDSGTLLLSFILSYFFVHSHNQMNLFRADEIFLLMMLPGIDMIRLTIERIRNKKNPLLGDRTHIHHLIENNFGYRITPLITLVLSSLPFLSYLILGNSFVLIIIFVILYILLLIYLKKGKKK